VLDIGVSSLQLDDPARGFSFQGDGPLDMRMAASGPTAADVINTAEEAQLADILFHLGEERSARGIARAILARRQQQPFTRTSELAQLAARVLGREKIAGRHAATRTFQALRIYVNDELSSLRAASRRPSAYWHPAGAWSSSPFHSLEDRWSSASSRTARRRKSGARATCRRRPAPVRHRVSRFLNHRPVSPTDKEVAANPRSRSAKLRAAVRTDAPAWDQDAGDLNFPRLDPAFGRVRVARGTSDDREVRCIALG
jgi:16S rRNA (cytosine1402-N4)-methyltransferase